MEGLLQGQLRSFLKPLLHNFAGAGQFSQKMNLEVVEAAQHGRFCFGLNGTVQGTHHLRCGDHRHALFS